MFSFKEKPLALNREYPALQNRKKQDAVCGSVSGCKMSQIHNTGLRNADPDPEQDPEPDPNPDTDL
jgi:hypothetical protein